ncbi:MAG: universal stress protein [Rhizobiaceae bacterium]
MAELSVCGTQATSESLYGHTGEIICETAEKLGDCQIFIGRQGSRKLADRLLGGLEINLIQASTVPVTIMR